MRRCRGGVYPTTPAAVSAGAGDLLIKKMLITRLRDMSVAYSRHAHTPVLLARNWQKTNSSTFLGWGHFRMFIGKYIVCYINGYHKQCILADTLFNYIFHFGLPGKCLYSNPQNTPFWRRLREVYCPDLFKGMFKSNMKNVVKDCVY